MAGDQGKAGEPERGGTGSVTHAIGHGSHPLACPAVAL